MLSLQITDHDHKGKVCLKSIKERFLHIYFNFEHWLTSDGPRLSKVDNYLLGALHNKETHHFNAQSNEGGKRQNVFGLNTYVRMTLVWTKK